MVIFEISNIFARKIQKKMRKTIIGIGNALVDALIKVENENILEHLQLPKGSMQLVDGERFEEVNQVIQGLPVTYATGGSAGNTILALARLGATPAFIGKVGHDVYGHLFADNCRASGIHTHLMPSPLATGVATTFITPDSQRTFATHLGAAATLTADDLEGSWFEGHHYLYIEGYLVQNHDLIESAVEQARKAGLKVCLDLASYNIVEADHDFFSYLLEKTDMVFANEEEAHAFTGQSPREALHTLAGLCETAIVKIGKDGAMAQSGEVFAECPALPVKNVVDTTAAGDFFAGGFLYAHAEGRPLEECLKAGSLLAGHVIQVVGTQVTDDTWAQLRTSMQNPLL